MVHLVIHNGRCNGSVDTTLKWRRHIRNVFTTSILQYCINLVSVLRKMSNASYALSYGNISTVLPQSCKDNQ